MRTVCNPYHSKELVQDTQDILYSLHKIVQLHWVKAHVGDEGNEAADRAAKQTTSLVESINIGLPHSHIKRLIKVHTLKLRQNKWEASKTGRHLCKLVPSISMKRLLSNGVLTQLFTNHRAFPAYFMCFIDISWKCPFWGAGEQIAPTIC